MRRGSRSDTPGSRIRVGERDVPSCVNLVRSRDRNTNNFWKAGKWRCNWLLDLLFQEAGVAGPASGLLSDVESAHVKTHKLTTTTKRSIGSIGSRQRGVDGGEGCEGKRRKTSGMDGSPLAVSPYCILPAARSVAITHGFLYVLKLFFRIWSQVLLGR